MTRNAIPVHPFTGARRVPRVTLKHRPLIWECMLGTVYAMGREGPRYFDYDWAAAREYAGVAAHSDLRLTRTQRSLGEYPMPGPGRLVLFGVPQRQELPPNR